METPNSWNCPGSTVPPSQTMPVTTSPDPCSPAAAGESDFSVRVVVVQPGTGCTDTELNRWSAGKDTSSRVVEASARSLGTRNTTLA